MPVELERLIEEQRRREGGAGGEEVFHNPYEARQRVRFVTLEVPAAVALKLQEADARSARFAILLRPEGDDSHVKLKELDVDVELKIPALQKLWKKQAMEEMKKFLSTLSREGAPLSTQPERRLQVVRGMNVEVYRFRDGKVYPPGSGAR